MSTSDSTFNIHEPSEDALRSSLTRLIDTAYVNEGRVISTSLACLDSRTFGLYENYIKSLMESIRDLRNDRLPAKYGESKVNVFYDVIKYYQEGGIGEGPGGWVNEVVLYAVTKESQ